jgi:hypothetical protein
MSDTKSLLLTELRSIVSAIDEAVNQKIRTGRMPNTAALLTQIRDGAQSAIDEAVSLGSLREIPAGKDEKGVRYFVSDDPIPRDVTAPDEFPLRCKRTAFVQGETKRCVLDHDHNGEHQVGRNGTTPFNWIT